MTLLLPASGWVKLLQDDHMTSSTTNGNKQYNNSSVSLWSIVQNQGHVSLEVPWPRCSQHKTLVTGSPQHQVLRHSQSINSNPCRIPSTLTHRQTMLLPCWAHTEQQSQAQLLQWLHPAGVSAQKCRFLGVQQHLMGMQCACKQL